GGAERSRFQVGTNQFRAGQIGSIEHRIFKRAFAQVGLAEHRLAKTRSAKTRANQLKSGQIRAIENDAGAVRGQARDLAQVRIGKSGVGDVGVYELRPWKHRLDEAGAAEAGA